MVCRDGKLRSPMQILINAIILWLISYIGFYLHLVLLILWSPHHPVLESHTHSPIYFPRCLLLFGDFQGLPSSEILYGSCPSHGLVYCARSWQMSSESLPPWLASVYMSVPSSGFPVTSCWAPPNPNGCLGDHRLPSTIFYQPDGLPVLGHCGSISDLPHLEQYVLSPRLPDPRFRIHLCQGRKFLDK